MTIVIATARLPRHRKDNRVTMGTKQIRHLRLHERRCDTVMGRAKEKRAGAIIGTARR